MDLNEARKLKDLERENGELQAIMLVRAASPVTSAWCALRCRTHAHLPSWKLDHITELNYQPTNPHANPPRGSKKRISSTLAKFLANSVGNSHLCDGPPGPLQQLHLLYNFRPMF